MTQFAEAFDATDVSPYAPRAVLPPGDYLAQIVRSDMKKTRDGTGQYLELKLSVVEGQHADHHLFARLNLVNSNPKTADIARRTLSAICRIVGVTNLRDSSELHWVPMTVQVTVRPSGPDKKGVHREAQNEIRAYSAPTTLPARPGVRPAANPASTPPDASPPTAPLKQPARWNVATA